MSTPDAAVVLGGRYELGEQIGAGGMAEVYRGVDVRLGRDVAIKVLRSELARDPAFQERFRREAQAAASLAAPEIVSVFDTGQDAGGAPYIVMELVDGRTLREVLRREGRLLPQRALEVAAEICAALDAAHRAGIVHRDITPGNVMLTASSGAVRVMDFGIARAAADSSAGVTQSAAVVGTAAYLSPEQARGEHVDARSDLYSTGCLLYELLTGAPPFSGDNPIAVAYQHVREDPDPPSSYDEALPPVVDAVVLKAMAKNPLNRYQSAHEMREDLLRARANEPVRATPVLEPIVTLAPAATTVPQYRDRSLARALAYGTFALVLIGLVVGVAMLVRALLGGSTGVTPAPGLVGLDQRDAAVILAGKGLRLGTVTEKFQDPKANPKVFGEVIEQTPQAGIVLPNGGTVTLIVSGGLEMTVVPEGLVGLARDEVSARLQQAKLVLGKDVGRDGNYPEGTVLAVSPAPGTQLVVQAPVVLTVATGMVSVPDARGRSQDEAQALLQKAGFTVGVRMQDDAGAPGRVLAQSPAGQTAPRGSTVIITVSQVPPPPPPPPSPVPAASLTPTPGASSGPSAAPSPSTAGRPSARPTPTR